ncbi:MAG: hypothetical protein J6B92_00210 [Paraprevotella sp.]|nr:hypothetical protein [Paraprevotella sp.]MBO5427615.1 hypothetical protein [Prevotella sp.]
MARPASKQQLISAVTDNYDKLTAFIASTSAHYDWALKKLKAHRKNLK